MLDHFFSHLKQKLKKNKQFYRGKDREKRLMGGY